VVWDPKRLPVHDAVRHHVRKDKMAVNFNVRASSHVFVPPDCPSKLPPGVVRTKVSEKWAPGLRSAKVTRLVPYIDKKGQIHATSVCSWKCSSLQLFATICATVYKRLWGKYLHHRKWEKPKPNDLFKIAVLYSLTNDDYWFRRTEELLQRTSSVTKHIYRRKMKLDDNTKVLYDQALKNALWFQSRVRKPNRVSCPQYSVVERDGRRTCPRAPASSVTDYSINYMIKEWAKVYTPTSLH
jgi:hypothetical protein